MDFQSEALAKAVEALAHITLAGNLLEQAFLLAGVDSPYMDLEHKVDAVTRDVDQAIKVSKLAMETPATPVC